MYLCRSVIDLPLKNIGKFLGNRDHTTVMHGINKIEQELEKSDSMKNTIDILKKRSIHIIDQLVHITGV